MIRLRKERGGGKQKLRRAILWLVAAVAGPPALYVLAAFGLALVPVNGDYVEPSEGIDVFLLSNGIHVDFLLPAETPVQSWHLELPPADFAGARDGWPYVLLGWGNRRFYLETPTWADLELGTALQAVWPGATVVHAEYMRAPPLEGDSCRRVRLGPEAYGKLCRFVREAFRRDPLGKPIRIPGKGYGDTDNFYEAEGSYHAFNTCNVWTQRGLAACGAPAPLWSPFAGGILRHLPVHDPR